jgi:hypothetical protein
LLCFQQLNQFLSFWVLTKNYPDIITLSHDEHDAPPINETKEESMTTKSQSRFFTVANIAGGGASRHRLDEDGHLSGRAIIACRSAGLGGPMFGGAAADEARAEWERVEHDIIDGYYD